MTAPAPEHVGMPARYLWLLRIGCGVLGLGLGFAVKPLVRWMAETVQAAPAPLRIAAEIPTAWAVPILTVLGAAVGYWLSYQAERDCLSVTVQSDGLITEHRERQRYIQRSQVGSVFTDRKHLVILDPDGRELIRGPASDLPKTHLATALHRHNYPWHGTHDPHEDQYQQWIDGHPDLDEETNTLLRARQAALHSKDSAELDRVHGQLQDAGLVVRDLGKKQQYRRLANGTNASAF